MAPARRLSDGLDETAAAATDTWPPPALIRRRNVRNQVD